jgi:hypothetical protein
LMPDIRILCANEEMDGKSVIRVWSVDGLTAFDSREVPLKNLGIRRRKTLPHVEDLFARGSVFSMEIRDASPADAPAVCVVLKRSIAELCEADHKKRSCNFGTTVG